MGGGKMVVSIMMITTAEKKYHLCGIAIKTGSNIKIGNVKFKMG
jgi:hypothetical protein